jgi:hypothetical protein
LTAAPWRASSRNVKVTYAAFSTAAKSVPEGFAGRAQPRGRAATGILGIAEADLKVYDFEVRTFRPCVRTSWRR